MGSNLALTPHPPNCRFHQGIPSVAASNGGGGGRGRGSSNAEATSASSRGLRGRFGELGRHGFGGPAPPFEEMPVGVLELARIVEGDRVEPLDEHLATGDWPAAERDRRIELLLKCLPGLTDGSHRLGSRAACVPQRGQGFGKAMRSVNRNTRRTGPDSRW